MVLNSKEEENKFEQLYNTYKASMFSIAKAILHDSGLAEDAVHQSFIKILNHLNKIEDGFSNKTKSFIVIIVRNTAIDIYRKNKKHPIVPFESLEEELAADTLSPTEFVIQEETFERMKTNISKLPPKYAEVLLLKYIQECTHEEIAKILQISNENVRYRLHKARKMILARMKENDEIEK